ncbi:MAG: shikimate kinase [Candidatus Hydrogenedentota bacterium]
MKSNLVLIGYRGTGKSTIARRLGARMERAVISLDEEIVRSAGLNIPSIVEKFGWNHFRDLESEEARKASSLTNRIIDAGGGVVLRPANVDALKNSGFCVLLTASVETIASRIASDANRPSLTGKNITDEIVSVLKEREELYRAAADVVISTDDKTIEEAVNGAERFYLGS